MNTIKDSFIYKLFSIINNFVKKLFDKSTIINGFFTEKDIKEEKENSILYKLIYKLISVLRLIFKKLKLDILLEGSIFTKPQIWITFVLALSPFIPTMMVLALTLFSTLTLILKIAIEQDYKLKLFKTNTWVLAFIVVVAFSAIASMAIR